MKGRALLAWNLRRLRVGKKISQQNLAADAGIDRAYVSELEREEGNATVDLLDRLATPLGCDIADVFEMPSKGDKTPKVLPGGRPRVKPRKTK